MLTVLVSFSFFTSTCIVINYIFFLFYFNVYYVVLLTPIERPCVEIKILMPSMPCSRKNMVELQGIWRPLSAKSKVHIFQIVCERFDILV